MNALSVLVLAGSTIGTPQLHAQTPLDWSHHHLVFSAPKDANQAAQIELEPRYQQQQARRKRAAAAVNSSVNPPSVSEQLNQAADLADENGLRPISLAETFAALKEKKRSAGLWGESLTASGTVGAGNYPAKYSFASAAVCGTGAAADFVAYNTSVAGGTSQPSIIGFNNLYSTCTGTVPSLAWAYNTGGTISTSVIISSTGTQLAFLHTPTSGASSLVILHWHAGDGTIGTPKGLTSQTSAANYATCRTSTTAACMYVIAFANGNNNGNSSPFYDYTNDILYVGDTQGVLHKFTGVFSGTPGESSSNGWPVAMSSSTTYQLTSPVYDSTSKLVFVGGTNIATSCATSGDGTGYLFSVTTGTGASQTVTTSELISRHCGFTDSPVVDSTSGKVYVFTSDDMNGSSSNSPCKGYSGGTSNSACNGVFQFTTTVSTAPVEVVMGLAAKPPVPTVFAGTFDNTFYTDGGTGGYVYVCGYTTTGTAGSDTVSAFNLNQIPVSTFSSAATATIQATLTGATGGCSPVSEADNGTDRVFLSVTGDGTVSSGTCNSSAIESAGCLYSYTVASDGTVTLASGLPASGGSSGIIIDYTASTSQIYFSYLSAASSTEPCPAPSGGSGKTSTSGGCAVQASQSALQ